MRARILLVLVAVALFAVPTFAQFTEPRMDRVDDGGGGDWSGSSTYQNGDYLDNPCTAWLDWVWVSYSADVYMAGEKLTSGEEQVLFDEYTSMGGAYAASGSSQSEVAAMQSYSLRQYHKVNTPDNFHVVTVITFDPASRTSSITRETACGNGMPDSIE